MSAILIARTTLAMCILVYLAVLALGDLQLIEAEAAMLAGISAVLVGALSAMTCVITQIMAYVRHKQAR